MRRILLIACLLAPCPVMALTVISDAPIDGKNIIAANKVLRFNSVFQPEKTVASPERQMPA